jgi:hypothetical protein
VGRKSWEFMSLDWWGWRFLRTSENHQREFSESAPELRIGFPSLSVLDRIKEWIDGLECVAWARGPEVDFPQGWEVYLIHPI